MKLNKKYIVLGIVLLAIIYAGNIFYYKKHILNKPIFIKCYYNIPQIDYINIFYIDNLNSKDKIVSIKFPELNQEYESPEVADDDSDRKYYTLKNIYIRMNENIDNNLITKAEVEFSSGKTVKADIGKIYLSNNVKNQQLKQRCTSSSSDNTGSSVFYAEKDIKLTGIKSKIYKDIEDICELNINDKKIDDINFPIELKKGDELEIEYSFKFNLDDIRRNNIYNFDVSLLTENAAGDKGESHIYINYKNQFPENYDIKKLINAEEDE